MAYANFKPTIWSKHILTNLPKFRVFANFCDYKFEGEVGEGKRVKIIGVARPTVKDYVPGTDIDAPEAVADTSCYLDIDQWKYMNFGMDNIDKAQATEGVMETVIDEGSVAMAEKQDAFIAELCAKNAGYTKTSASANTADELVAIIDDMFVNLWANGVGPNAKTELVLTPWAYNIFKSKIIALRTDNDDLIASGVLGLYNNAKVKMSNNVYNDGTDDVIVLRTNKAVAFVEGLDKMKAFEPEKGFAEAIKVLNTYGAKVVRPKELAVAYVHNS